MDTTLLVTGDLMTGRGIDQVLPHPSDPVLYEPWIRDARDYVALAERASGPVPRRVPPAWIWGDALAILDAVAPDVRLVNLETSVTTSATPSPEKDIHYRMHPDNVAVLTAARVDGCVLANNHVLDWGLDGLVETLATLQTAGLRTVGAGRDYDEAVRPAVFDVPAGRVLVFAGATGDCGVPPSWAAGPGRPGVNRIDLSASTVATLADAVRRARRPGDVIVLSVHWGGNWGFDVPAAQRAFARAVVDRAGVDVVWGHSSHHVKAFEVYQDRLILYGCGDLLTDYEGISGHEAHRGELTALWFPVLAPDGRLVRLRVRPVRVRNLRLTRATADERAWVRGVLGEDLHEQGEELVWASSTTASAV